MGVGSIPKGFDRALEFSACFLIFFFLTVFFWLGVGETWAG
jgi:hypothetical protein